MNNYVNNCGRPRNFKAAGKIKRAWGLVLVVALALAGTLAGPRLTESAPSAGAAGLSAVGADPELYKKRVPDLYASATAVVSRKPSAAQLRVLASDGSAQSQPGITYADTPFFTTNERTYRVEARMTSPSFTAEDIDLYLLDSAGRVVAAAESASATEQVAVDVLPNRQYRYRVAAYSGFAQDFNIDSKQLLAVPKNTGGGTASGGSTGGGSSSGGSLTGGFTSARLIRFTVNPLTGKVTAQLIR